MRTVLLADDSPFLLETVAARLRHNGNHVITATNGAEAIQQSTLSPPDLAILDVSMPVLNGLEAAKRLHEMMPNLPIILFTAYAETLNSSLHQSGVIAIFDKSSKLSDLVKIVDECLWRKENFG